MKTILPVTLAALTLLGYAIASHPPQESRVERAEAREAATETTRTGPRDALIQHLATIERAASALWERPRDARPAAGVQLREIAAIRTLLGLDNEPPPVDPTDPVDPPLPPRPPPEPVDPTPPPPGPWVKPTDPTVGAGPTALIRSSQWGHNIPAEVPFSLQVATVEATAAGVAVVNKHGPTGVGQPVTWTNCVVQGIPDASGNLVLRWGMQLEDANGTLQNCTFGPTASEHNFYGRLDGPVRFERCRFNRAFGQAIQLVYASPNDPQRRHETGHSAADWIATVKGNNSQWIEVLDCVFDQCGQWGDRSSYVVSKFEDVSKIGRHPLRIARCYLDTEWATPVIDGNGVAVNGKGAFMCHEASRVEILECYARTPNPDREFVQLWGNSDGKPGTVDQLIRGCTFIASREVDIRTWDKTDTIVLQGNVGSTVSVIVSSNPPYVFRNSPAWDSQKVLYQGVLSQDASIDGWE